MDWDVELKADPGTTGFGPGFGVPPPDSLPRGVPGPSAEFDWTEELIEIGVTIGVGIALSAIAGPLGGIVGRIGGRLFTRFLARPVLRWIRGLLPRLRRYSRRLWVKLLRAWRWAKSLKFPKLTRKDILDVSKRIARRLLLMLLPRLTFMLSGLLFFSGPRFQDEVTVTVYGQPGASKHHLYLLALSTAFGVARRFRGISSINPFSSPLYAALQIRYDAADNWVECHLAYDVGMHDLIASIVSITTGRTVVDYQQLAVYNGPSNDVIGGKFDYVDDYRTYPGIPSSATERGVPTLPFEGRHLLTYRPIIPDPAPRPVTNPPTYTAPPDLSITNLVYTPNPKPPGDNRSRGHVIYPYTGLDGQVRLVTGPMTPAGIAFQPGSPHLYNADYSSVRLPGLVLSALQEPGGTTKQYFYPPTFGPLGG